MVAWPRHETGNDQLPHIQARARRVVLRAHLRSGDRLGVPVRKIQTHEASRRDLRQMRRRGHTGESPPREAGPHRVGQPLLARLVLQRGCPRASGTCSTSPCANSRRSSTSRTTSSSRTRRISTAWAFLSKSARWSPTNATGSSSRNSPASSPTRSARWGRRPSRNSAPEGRRR